MRRVLVGLLGLAALGSAIAVGLVNAGLITTMPSPPPDLAAFESAAPTTSPTTGPAPSSSQQPPIATATPGPTATPRPTPRLVPAPLTGVLVTPAAARRHPIAVMIDDLGPARPQSGFNAASVVWQAPAESGIPRYMLIFQENIPLEVGPVRSARQYYIAWAAEWTAMYVHVGGSGQALRTLREDGQGELVYDADEFRWGGRYLWRVDHRFAPHNVYTDGRHLRQLLRQVGASDVEMTTAWRFGSELSRVLRPKGGLIEVAYPANRIRYRYDRATNTYRRSVTGEDPQTDAATDEVVAPRNVIVMHMNFAALDDGQPWKGRLEAQYVGSGTAWIATNGHTIKGRWKKAAIDKPTRFFDNRGRPVVLAPGQTFIQVVPTGTAVKVRNGKEAVVPSDPPLVR